ncbi:DUF4870 domain-containing protein [Pyxidicoccus fallax]|nr:DUF4870 domain-containing protein [Pyxidicoccus fallax]
MPTQDEKTMGMLAHIGTLIANLFVGFGFLVPLFLMLTKGKESSFIREHSVESLNFQITCFIGFVIGGITACFGVGLVIIAAVWIASVAFAIIAGLKAKDGELYRYPATIRFVK